MTTLFITATGTDVGKTYVSTALTAALAARGRSVRALKPVASGFDPTACDRSDSALLLRAQGLPLDSRHLDAVTPWRFAAPLSPDMAAARERRRIDFAKLVAFCALPGEADVTLIEGIGGVMVPLDAHHTVLDLIAALECRVLLVAGSYLGTLSHTLCAAGMLRSRGAALAGVVVSESPEQPVPPDETAAVLRRFLAPTEVAVLPRAGGGEPPDTDALLALVERIV